MEEKINERIKELFDMSSTSEAFDITHKVSEEFNISFLLAYKAVSNYLSRKWKV